MTFVPGLYKIFDEILGVCVRVPTYMHMQFYLPCDQVVKLLCILLVCVHTFVNVVVFSQ